MKKVLVAGAGSYIGTSFELYMSRWPERYQVDTVDMIDGTWRTKRFSGYEVVYHVAGIAHSDNGAISAEKEKLYYAVNTDLTIETARKAKAEGVGQFIFMSSAIVYGESAPIGKEKRIGKDTPVAPANCYGDSKLKAEEGLALLADDDFKVVILRPPMIYGRGSKGNYPLLAKIARTTPVFPKLKNERSMLYVENLCEFVRLMIENNESGVFWPQNAEYSSTADLVRRIAALHGKKIKFIPGMTGMLNIISRFNGLVNKAFGNLTYDMELSEYKAEYRIVSLEESIRRTENGK